MTSSASGPGDDSFEDLFEDAPCGYVTTALDGTILRVNRTFERWTGLTRDQLVESRRFQDLLSPGGRIYHETHYAPLLHMQGAVSEVATEIVRADGSRLAALISSVLHRDLAGDPQAIRTVLFAATDRRRYEQELQRRQQRERGIAHQLQHSLLTGDAPEAADFEIEMAYQPGASHLEIGGDWHDAFWLTELQTLALVVGDVVGQGVDAAATMGQLRSAVRAFALSGMSPARVLAALDDYARHHRVGRLATLVYAQVDVASREVRYACAGHPPPVLLTPGQAPMLLWEGRSAPLAVNAREADDRHEARHTLEPGGGIVLYTDGLTDHRGQPLEDGLERLRRTVAAHEHDGPLATLASTLLRVLRDDEHPDDACVLAIRLRPQPQG